MTVMDENVVCYGGPMDGSLAPLKWIKDDLLVRVVVPRGYRCSATDETMYVWEWSKHDRMMPGKDEAFVTYSYQNGSLFYQEP